MMRMSLSLVVALVAVLAISGAAVAQPKFEFKLGFKALADQIPDVVGEPTEDERWGANGDSLQMTTKGLMAWRKADNWTAFTNGSRTWINGPTGAQERGNDDRFDWEAPPPAATPVPARPTATPVTLGTYSFEIKAMDDQSAAQGGWVTAFVKEVETEWASSFGWKPSRPAAVYLFYDGNRLADTLASLRDSPLTDSEKKTVPNNISNWSTVSQPRGWAVLINLSRGAGTKTWQANIKAGIVSNCSQVMQNDVGLSRAPRWFRFGFADLLAFSKVPEVTTDDTRPRLLARYRDAGKLPTLMDVAQNFDSMMAAGGDSYALAYGISDLAVSVLSDKVGAQALLEIEKRVAVGENFLAALQAVTGYTLDQLDKDFRVKIPRS